MHSRRTEPGGRREPLRAWIALIAGEKVKRRCHWNNRRRGSGSSRPCWFRRRSPADRGTAPHKARQRLRSVGRQVGPARRIGALVMDQAPRMPSSRPPSSKGFPSPNTGRAPGIDDRKCSRGYPINLEPSMSAFPVVQLGHRARFDRGATPPAFIVAAHSRSRSQGTSPDTPATAAHAARRSPPVSGGAPGPLVYRGPH